MVTMPMTAFPSSSPAETISGPQWSTRKCLVFHAALVMVIIGLYFLLTPGSFLIAAGVFVATYFFFMLYMEGKRAPLKISPLSVYFLWQAFALGLAGVYTGFQLVDGSSLPFSWHVLSPQVVATGYMVGLIGTVPLHAGLQVSRPKPAAELPNTSPGLAASLLMRFGLLYAVGICILPMGDKLRFMGTLTSSFEFAAHAALVGFVLIPKEQLKLPEATRLLIVLMGTAGLLLASVASGAKLYLMYALIGLLVYVLQNKNLKRHLPSAGLAFLFFYMTVVAPTVSKSRELRTRYSMDMIPAQIEAFKLASPLITGHINTEFYSEQMETLFKRQFEVISIAYIVQDVQVRGYLNGETFYQLRYAFIPRFIWPEKPWVIRGGWFTSYLGASPREQDSMFAVGMEAAGELYWNFGIGGMLAGMFIIGAMIGGLWRMAGDDPRAKPMHLALYIYLSLSMMNMPEAGSRMVACISLFLIYGTIFFLLQPHRRTKAVVFQRAQISRPI